MTPTLTGTYPPLFSSSALVKYQEFSFELMPDSAGRHRAALEALRPDVLEIAAKSRGWRRAQDLEHFHQVFKLEALFEANGLALIWQDGKLVGLAGMTYDLPIDDGVILHVGSLGLLPEAQNRGFLPTLFSMLWDVVWRDPAIRQKIVDNRCYLTAITQSPFIMAFLASVCDLYPMPGRHTPPPDMVKVAESVVSRFDPHISFDRMTFILRNECEFFYRHIPYSADSRINEFCDQQLRYHEGDTFAAVGRVRADAVQRFVQAVERSQAELFGILKDALLRMGK